MREKEEMEKSIKNLENEKNNLIIEKENLISNMNHIDSRIKAKGPKNTDMSKRFQNIGQSSMTMIRTDLGKEKSARKSNQNNISLDSGTIEDKNNHSMTVRKSNLNSSGHKINNSFSGQKNSNNSSNKKLENTSEIGDKEDGNKKNHEIKEEERKSLTKKNK
jgi:hypothetical protein